MCYAISLFCPSPTYFLCFLFSLFVFSVQVSPPLWNISWSISPLCTINHSCFCVQTVYVFIMAHTTEMHLAMYVYPSLYKSINKFLMKFNCLQHLNNVWPCANQNSSGWHLKWLFWWPLSVPSLKITLKTFWKYSFWQSCMSYFNSTMI